MGTMQCEWVLYWPLGTNSQTINCFSLCDIFRVAFCLRITQVLFGFKAILNYSNYEEKRRRNCKREVYSLASRCSLGITGRLDAFCDQLNRSVLQMQTLRYIILTMETNKCSRIPHEFQSINLVGEGTILFRFLHLLIQVV